MPVYHGYHVTVLGGKASAVGRLLFFIQLYHQALCFNGQINSISKLLKTICLKGQSVQFSTNYNCKSMAVRNHILYYLRYEITSCGAGEGAYNFMFAVSRTRTSEPIVLKRTLWGVTLSIERRGFD